jgi:DNA replication protein DnaC
MLQANTVQKLYDMKFAAMAKAFQDQVKNPAAIGLGFEDRFSMLVDEEWTARRNNLKDRLKRTANFAFSHASIEGIEYREDRNLDKAMITRLSTNTYVDEHHNLILLGATGSGKTYLACAFGNKAAENFYSVRYIRLPELLSELAIARVEGKYNKVLAKYKQVKLLILDEWMLYKFKEAEARDVLEIAESRYKKRLPSSALSLKLPDGIKKSANPPSRTRSVTVLSMTPVQ